MFALHHHASAATPARIAALVDDTHDRVAGEVVVRGELPRGLIGVLFRECPGRFRRGGESAWVIPKGLKSLLRGHITQLQFNFLQ